MEGSDSGNMILLDQVSRMLAEAETLDEVTAIRSRAEAVRSWAKNAAMSLEMQNRAAELKLRAERKAGELLSALRLRGGDRKSTGRQERLKLSDLGISQNQSKRWQKEAAIPEAEFQRYIRRAGELGEELSTAGLLRLSRRATPVRVDTRRSRTDGRRAEPLSACPETIEAEGREPRDYYGERDGSNARGIESPEWGELIEELANHHALLSNLLDPLCDGRQEALLPGQRRGVRHYLSEIGQLLTLLTTGGAAKRA